MSVRLDLADVCGDAESPGVCERVRRSRFSHSTSLKNKHGRWGRKKNKVFEFNRIRCLSSPAYTLRRGVCGWSRCGHNGLERIP